MPEQTLPPYTGEGATCPKCARIGALTAYRKTGDARAGDFFAVEPGERDERLERRCPRCSYVWDEALATEGEQPQPALVQVGWYCWRCHGLVEHACRSDSVPVHVPADWAGDMQAEIRRLGEEDDS